MISRRMALGAGIATVATACTQSEQTASESRAYAAAADSSKADCCCQPGRQIFMMSPNIRSQRPQTADFFLRSPALMGQGLGIVFANDDFPAASELRSFDDLRAFVDVVNKARQGGARIRGFSGMGGTVGLGFFNVVEALSKSEFVVGRPSTAATFCVSGLIDCDNGYSYNAVDGSGHINSTTFVKANLPGGSVFEFALRWKVRVMKNSGQGFRVTEKDLSDPNDVFPDPDNDVEVDIKTAACFNYKLWAVGDDIKVDSVEISTNGGATWTLINPADPIYGGLYETDAESCIDLMFEEKPPATFPDDEPRPFYCMGRCNQPFLVNTK